MAKWFWPKMLVPLSVQKILFREKIDMKKEAKWDQYNNLNLPNTAIKMG